MRNHCDKQLLQPHNCSVYCHGFQLADKERLATNLFVASHYALLAAINTLRDYLIGGVPRPGFPRFAYSVALNRSIIDYIDE